MIADAELARLIRDAIEDEVLGLCAKFPALGAERLIEQRARRLRAKTGCGNHHAWSCAVQLARANRGRDYRRYPRRSVLN